MYSNDNAQNPVKSGGGGTPERSAAILVFGCLAFLIAVHMGFRGLSVSGATGGLVH